MARRKTTDLRAKRNSTNGIQLRMKTIQLKIAEINKEISLYTRYRKKFPRGTSTYKWIGRVIVVLARKKLIRTAQLGRYKDRYEQRKREGKVF